MSMLSTLGFFYFVILHAQCSFGLSLLQIDPGYVPVNSKTAHPPPPLRQTPGHLTFLKNFGQIPRYVASLDGQMPHPLELQRGSNPPPSRHVKATVLNFFSCVKPFIQMYIFCNKQLATVWIKICVNCNFNDNRVIC